MHRQEVALPTRAFPALLWLVQTRVVRRSCCFRSSDSLRPAPKPKRENGKSQTPMVAEAAEGRSTGDEGCCLTIRELVAETASSRSWC